MRLFLFLASLLIFAALTIALAQPREASQAPVVIITGDVEKQLQFDLEQLGQFLRNKVLLREGDGTIKFYEGARLSDVLFKAGVTISNHPKGKELATTVIVEASDGYKVAFGLGELEPTISGRTVLLAIEADGKPLEKGIGPVRLVVADDKKPARSVRMVSTIRVVKLRE